MNRPNHKPVRRTSRRGVTGVLAMMFLIIFSSLALAMAVMSKGNLRAAETHQRVVKAQGALDTGIEIARARLTEAASRFVVARGRIDADYARELWQGTYDGDPVVRILPAHDGREEPNTPGGIADILTMHHAADEYANMISSVSLGSAPAGWVRADPIALQRNSSGEAVSVAQIDYALPDAQGRVLVMVTGYEWDWLRSRWITRSAQMSFELVKIIPQAIISPSRIMLGRNVMVNGPLGVRYDSAALDTLDGPPLVSRSDFDGLDDALTAKLTAFYATVLADDVDGDNKLRITHPTESRSLGTLNAQDYNGDSAPDSAFQDRTRDDAVDDFDIFIKHYDGDGDGEIVLGSRLTAGTPAAADAAEFNADEALGLLIDGANPDRNGNGKYNGRLEDGEWVWSTFPDNNGDGEKNADDLDPDDITLGYRDGVLDYRDSYAKINGSVYFKASRTAWENSSDDFGELIGDYQELVQGPVDPDDGEAPVQFEASDNEVPAFTDESFAAAAASMTEFSEEPGVDADDFATVISAQVGDEWSIEPTPYGSPSPADWYRRPVYRDLTFRNTTIPMGTNALFINCTFVGVTRVRTWIDNDHPSFTYYGQQSRDVETGALELMYPPPPSESPHPLDTSYLDLNADGVDDVEWPAGSEPVAPFQADTDGDGDTENCTDSKLVSNNIRFHDCTFIGSVVADKPEIFTHVRNKITFTGATKFVDEHPTEPVNPDYVLTDQEEATTSISSMMLPHYSVDIGSNNSSPDQDVQLHGAIIAGVLDVRGNADITGALLLTYQPVYGAAPLEVYGAAAGHPAGFNVTLGYFGPDEGDGEGMDLSDMEDLDGDGILDVGWDSARDGTGALVPLGTSPEEDSWFDGLAEEDADPGLHIRRAVPFNGFGRITLNLDPNLILPDGLEAPLTLRVIASTYSEGRFAYAEED